MYGSCFLVPFKFYQFVHCNVVNSTYVCWICILMVIFFPATNGTGSSGNLPMSSGKSRTLTATNCTYPSSCKSRYATFRHCLTCFSFIFVLLYIKHNKPTTTYYYMKRSKGLVENPSSSKPLFTATTISF